MKIASIVLLAVLPLVSSFSLTPANTRTSTAIASQQALLTPQEWVKSTIATVVLGVMLLTPSGAFAADYANLDIAGQDFSNGNYQGKDFTQVIAKGTNFQKSNLQGCHFSKANLINADFSGADLTGASFEDAVLDGVSLKDAIAVRADFTASILDVENFENVDLTSSLWPSKLAIMLCEELKGENPTTGVSSKGSILCP
jgi:uncharacterized protein YjbI with pentapeptide repeats